MAVQVPPATNYPNPLVAIPTIWNQAPPEGGKAVNLEIDWRNMGNPNDICYNINIQNNSTLNFSQIVALSVDNSQCGIDVQFVFPDTAETLTIPAYAPKVICPVFTRMTQFFIIALGNTQNSYITRFSVHNEMPPPISVPAGIEQEISGAGGIVADGSTGAVLTATGGTIEALQITRVGPLTATGSQGWQIHYPLSGILLSGGFAGTSGVDTNVSVVNLQNISLVAPGPLDFRQTGANLGGYWFVYLLFRKP